MQTHTRFKLKIGIEIEPEPMELPECKAGSAIGKCKTGSRKKERKRAQMWTGRYVQGWRAENRNCVFSGTGANLIKSGAGLAGQKPVRNS